MFGFLGLGRLGSVIAGGIGGGGGVPAAPTITWTSAPTDNTPNFDIGIPEGNGAPLDVVAGDVLIIENSGDGGSTWNAYLSHTITSGDISSGTINQSGVSAVADGNYLFRGHFSRSGAGNSANSSTVSVTIDTTGPTITTSPSQSVNSLTTLAVALTATGGATGWSITGGVDQAEFQITGTTLQWISNGVQDFASPQDADANNTYIVEVTAEDTYGNPSTETITVTVLFVAAASRDVALGQLYLNGTGSRQYAVGESYVVEA